MKTAIIRMSRPEIVLLNTAREEKITKISLLQPVNVKILVKLYLNENLIIVAVHDPDMFTPGIENKKNCSLINEEVEKCRFTVTISVTLSSSGPHMGGGGGVRGGSDSAV